jgi:D-psicose/D-tagatose/L-ribulose 3-epimerase
MRLAISNIAWPADADQQAAALLRERQVTGVEIAPTKVWPHPLEATGLEILAHRRQWERSGLQIVALQALLFEKPHFRVFGKEEQRRECFDYLCGIIRLASQLGARVLVFGSPKNRVVGDLPRDVARQLAVNFFRELGEQAVQHGVVLCIEPNPPEYGCDFVTTVAQGVQLVQAVNHPGLGLHLDAGGMHLSGESVPESLALGSSCWQHFHISEPFLAPVGNGCVAHDLLGAELNQAGYPHWRSIEMKCPGENWGDELGLAIERAQRSYCGAISLQQPVSV